MSDNWQWVAAVIIVPIVIGILRVWWHTEQAQNKEIDNLQTCNHKDHQAIREELIATKDELTQQHMHIRDRLEDIWKHIARSKD